MRCKVLNNHRFFFLLQYSAIRCNDVCASAEFTTNGQKIAATSESNGSDFFIKLNLLENMQPSVLAQETQVINCTEDAAADTVLHISSLLFRKISRGEDKRSSK
ncbi:unnamed protein product [Rangifer tarandus platyrhynchus]|uniref:Uncharacterized protein n=1 Tax=Rangifer tarandus platyrhynchus TaxID=3082113 RepID=A0ABN8XME3_RANTA|nr:unnamed protein product [Rangifer tarandus platyrhynchus]